MSHQPPLQPDTQAEIEARVRDALVERLLRQRLHEAGFDTEHIGAHALLSPPDHDRFGCTLRDQASGLRDCRDDNGRSRHPDHDTVAEARAWISWTVERMLTSSTDDTLA